jgi:FkbH-like protein
MAADPEWSVCYARAKDAFDDNGIVAVALVRHGGRTDHIDTLLMSCRVIGRGVERAVLAFVADRSRARGAERLAAEYIPTTKNALAATFLPDSKFKRAEGEDQWVFDLAEPMERPTWFKSVTVLAAPAATGV